MKKLLILNKIFGVIAFIGAVVSLNYKLNLTLIMSVILMYICVVITFSTIEKAEQ